MWHLKLNFSTKKIFFSRNFSQNKLRQYSVSFTASFVVSEDFGIPRCGWLLAFRRNVGAQPTTQCQFSMYIGILIKQLWGPTVLHSSTEASTAVSCGRHTEPHPLCHHNVRRWGKCGSCWLPLRCGSHLRSYAVCSFVLLNSVGRTCTLTPLTLQKAQLSITELSLPVYHSLERQKAN
jgi:hypothetical protein